MQTNPLPQLRRRPERRLGILRIEDAVLVDHAEASIQAVRAQVEERLALLPEVERRDDAPPLVRERLELQERGVPALWQIARRVGDGRREFRDGRRLDVRRHVLPVPDEVLVAPGAGGRLGVATPEARVASPREEIAHRRLPAVEEIGVKREGEHLRHSDPRVALEALRIGHQLRTAPLRAGLVELAAKVGRSKERRKRLVLAVGIGSLGLPRRIWAPRLDPLEVARIRERTVLRGEILVPAARRHVGPFDARNEPEALRPAGHLRDVSVDKADDARVLARTEVAPGLPVLLHEALRHRTLRPVLRERFLAHA